MQAVSRIFAGALLLAAPAAFAQSSATVANVPASARIFKAITLIQTSGLNFGDIFPSGVAGTVVMPPVGVRSFTGGVALATTGTSNAAAFNVTGKKSATYAITFATPTINLSAPGATDMVVSAFTTSAGSGTLSATGTQSFTVGATLAVGVDQLDGDYSGTFGVTVTYN